MEKFVEYLDTAEKKLQIADHMTHVTFPLIKDKRLLLKILSEISFVVLNCINAILQYEYMYKRIQLTRDAQTNLRIFKEKCAPHHKLTEQEVVSMMNILDLAEKHKKSPFEFIKEGKVVILSENLKHETVTIEKIKWFLINCKSIVKKIRERIKGRP